MILSTAKKTDIPELKAMWQEIFKDTDAYLDLFFGSKMEPELTLIVRAENEIAAMLYMVDAPLVTGEGEQIPAFYLCGIATRPAYRGQGLAGKLIESAFALAKEKNAKVCYLIPANLPLFDFYKRFGMECRAYMKKGAFYGEEGVIPPFKTEKDISALQHFYDEMQLPFKPLRTEKDWEYIYACYESVLLFENGYMVLPEDEEAVYLSEQSFDGFAVAKAIAHQKGKKMIYALPGTKNDTPFAVVKYLCEGITLPDGYINLMLN